EPEQGQQGGARVQIALAVRKIRVGEQDLRGAQPVLAEARLVSLREAHLPHRGGGLELVHGAWPSGPAQPLHALGDRSARYEHDLPASLPEARDLARPARDRRRVQARAAVGDERAADLDDEAPGFAHRVLPVSKNFITDMLSSRQPSPASAEMRKLGPRQRSLRSRSLITASRCSPASISILLKTSQRGLR